MSAAIWNQPSADPHPGLGQRTIQRDNLPGRTPTRTTVRLVVWGVTRADIEHATYRARYAHVSSHRWDITTIDRRDDDACPIQRNDPQAIAQDTDYHYAWAVYPVAA